MHSIHERLRKTIAWYHRWHNDDHSNTVTWGIFLLVALTYTSLLLSSITLAQIDIEGAEQMGRAIAPLVRDGSPKVSDNIVRLRAVTDDTINSSREYSRSSLGEKATHLEKLKVALSKRQTVVRELALSDPHAVKQFVYDELALQSIPVEVRNLVENPFEKEGIYHRALVSEEFTFGGNEVSHEEYLLEVTPTEIYKLALTQEEAEAFPAEENITISGFEIGESIVIPTNIAIEGDGEGKVLGAAVTKKIAIVAFNFLNDTSRPLSVEEMRGRIFTDPSSMSAFFKEMSYGQMLIQGRDRIDGDVYDWVTIPVNGGDCAYNNWASLANKALTDKGINMTGYSNIQYIFPGGAAGCGWAGLAYMPGSTSWVVAGYMGAGISGHEFGHNVGFHHASSYGCSIGTNTLNACNPSEYGDGHDVMGSGAPRHTNTYNKARFWFDPTNVISPTQSGTFTLEPTETSGTGLKLIRLKRPFAAGSYMVTNGYYHIEFKTPTGFDSYLGASAVMVSLVSDYANGGASKTYSVSTLSLNQTFTDTEAGITITPRSISLGGATIELQLTTAPCVRNTPTLSISPVGQWGSAGSPLSYSAIVRNNDSETCGSSVFSITPTLPNEFVQSPSLLSLTLSPLEQNSVAFTITSPNTVSPATYSFSQVAQNNAVATSAASASANYNVLPPDATPPEVSITSPQSGTTLKGTKTSVSASASDTSGIARIDITIDGTIVKTCSAVQSCTYSWMTRKVTAGQHTITASAIDNSPQKNRAETSISVTK